MCVCHCCVSLCEYICCIVLYVTVNVMYVCVRWTVQPDLLVVSDGSSLRLTNMAVFVCVCVCVRVFMYIWVYPGCVCVCVYI